MHTTIFLLLFFLLASCRQGTFHDPALQKTEEDFYALLKPHPEAKPSSQKIETKEEPPLPVIFQTPISMDITPAMDVPYVLETLCRKAGLSYMVDPNIDGTLSYNIHEQPFLKALRDICKALHLRFSYKEQILHIEKDIPFLKTYPLTFLSQERTSHMHMASNTNIFSGHTEAGKNGSEHTLESKNTYDIWPSFEETLKKLFGEKLRFSLEKHAGLLHVWGTQQQHDLVTKLLAQFQSTLSQQVLIEAKVIEVSLKEAYKGGIDWAKFHEKKLSLETQTGAMLRSTSALSGYPLATGANNIGIQSASLKSLLTFMESFGTVRTLSSPRIAVMHNQSALLKVAENQIFFDVKYERQFLNTNNKNYGSSIAVHSHIQSIPIGFVLSVHPTICSATQEILLNLRPTISRIVGTKEDPAVQLMAQSLQSTAPIVSEIPIVAIREIDSVLRLRSGETAILGGLMVEGSDNASTGLPGMRRGKLSFLTSARQNTRVMTELVIFLRATILKNPAPHQADQHLYQQFTQDPRPLKKGNTHDQK